MLDNVIDYNLQRATGETFQFGAQTVGIGLMGFRMHCNKQQLAYTSEQAIQFADESMEAVSLWTSASIWQQKENIPVMKVHSRAGILPIDSIDMLEKKEDILFKWINPHSNGLINCARK